MQEETPAQVGVVPMEKPNAQVYSYRDGGIDPGLAHANRWITTTQPAPLNRLD